jgi:hypothetical protein
MAILWDKPRPSVYWPGTPSQWREPTVDDCTWYAVEFAFEAASKTHLSMHPVRDLRRHSSDTVGGTPVPVALREVDKLWPTSEGVRWTYGAESRATIRRALIDGDTIVWGGDYEKLPTHYKRWTNNDIFDHAMASRDFRTYNGTGQTFLYDPIGGGPQRDFYDGEWISLDALMEFSWSGAGGEWVGIVRATKQQGDTMIKGPFERTSSRYVELPVGVKVFNAPEGKVVKRIGTAKKYDYFGYTNDYWAIELWVMGEPVIAYVKKNDNWDRGNWPIPVEPEPEPDPALIAAVARIGVLEAALADIEETAETALL